MATGSPIVLSVRNLTKTYRSAGEQVVVLRGMNLAVAAGERVALTGESGSGKSTLLHLIAGLDAADGGEIILAGASVTDLSDAGRAALRRDRLGLVFQQFNLIPSLNVLDNLVFQSRIAGRHDPAWHAELVQRLGLGALLKRYPEQLSAASSRGLRSAVRWRRNRCFCSPTSRPVISTRRRRMTFLRSRAIW
jgi:putative ABC transport system ATP-binding protein